MLVALDTGEQRTFLQGISWNLYEILAEIGDGGKARLSYHRGDLEFMTPLQSGKYAIVDRSSMFPILAPDRVLEFLTDCQTHGVNQAVKILRKWIQANR